MATDNTLVNSLSNGLIKIEAEQLQLSSNFLVSDIDPSASGGKIIRARPGTTGVAKTVFNGAAGTYSLTLDAYDENDGRGQLSVRVNGRTVNTTTLNKNLGSNIPTNLTRFQIVVDNLALKPGDVVEIVGRSDADEYTSLDKITFAPKPPTTIKIEAEQLQLSSNFLISNIDPGASGGKIIRARPGTTGFARTVFNGVAATYSLTLDAYDENDGRGQLSVRVNGNTVNTTTLNKNLGSNVPDGRTRVQIVVDNLALKPGDVVEIVGRSDANEFTSLDKITFTPKAVVPPAVMITSNGGGDSAVITIDEGVSTVTDLEVNVGDSNVVYQINDGADKDLFTISPTTGQLSFKTAPNWDNPLDADRNNVYEVNVVAAGATSGDGQFLSVVVRDVVTNPSPVVIVSNDTGAPNNSFTTVQLAENLRVVTNVNVQGSEAGVRYSLNAGADRDLFVINPETGILSFKQAPDWERPLDRAEGSAIAGDNIYEVNILAQRDGQSDSQFMTIQVNDSNEANLPAPVSVYLMAGQSNLVGEALASGLDPVYAQPFPAAKIWSAPTESFVTLAPGFDGQTTKVGPEFSFGRRIAGRTGANVYLVKYGLGSTSLEKDWNPDGTGNQYNKFRDTVNLALDELTESGLTYKVNGLVWMQGESDTYNDSYAPKYQDNLTNFIGSVRNLYGADLQVAIGLIRGDLPTSATNRELVRAAQRAVGSADPRNHLVNTDVLGGPEILIANDPTHYNAAGQVALGNAFGDAFTV
jgi:DNA-directed RNA polymerase subunit H (RpoH/RPB5)